MCLQVTTQQEVSEEAGQEDPGAEQAEQGAPVPPSDEQLHTEDREDPGRGQSPAQSRGVRRDSHQEVGESQEGAGAGGEAEQEAGGGRPVDGVPGLQPKSGRYPPREVDSD